MKVEVVDGGYMGLGKVGWEKVFEERGRVMGIIICVVDGRVGYVGYEMREGNIGDVVCEGGFYGVGVVVVVVDGVGEVIGEMVECVVVWDRGDVEMYIVE